ncbi:DUF3800 domain-containing protein [Kocuria palustris]|uniref:DUF3800 domain-containing protein n=1 Tax=Kocuria palustris TaxID=71999 RepID=UPI00344D8E67
MDESGSKGSGGEFFVLAAVKTDDPDALARGMMSIRDQYGFKKDEFKFNSVSKKTLPAYKAIIDMLEASGAQIGASVIDKGLHDPFNDRTLWEGHAWVSAALIKGMATRNELLTVLCDGISVPSGVSYGNSVQRMVNGRFQSTRLASVVSLDSCTCDGLQLADMMAGAIHHGRRGHSQVNIKAQLGRYVRRAFDLEDFHDQRTSRVNIKTILPRKDAPAACGTPSC